MARASQLYRFFSAFLALAVTTLLWINSDTIRMIHMLCTGACTSGFRGVNFLLLFALFFNGNFTDFIGSRSLTGRAALREFLEMVL